jgi:vitamin B12 transporter
MFKSFSFSVLLLLATCCNLHAQSDELPLKHIPEVTIVESNKDYFSDDNPTCQLTNSSPLNRMENLGYLLERESQVLIKSYGAEGSLVSLSLHGTGSNHTQVSWNGFPLNSPTTGQADLSLIPSGFMQTIEVINGASGALFGSGTFGGTINMANEPDWNNKFSAQYAVGLGSFGSFSNNLFFRTGSRHVQYHVSVISGSAENNFSYHDYYKYNAPLTQASHNAFHSWGFIQNVYFTLGNGHYLEAGMWYQQKVKEMPPLMGYYQPSHAVQRDSLLRSYISYRKTGSNYMLNIRSAWFSDYLRYTDKANELDSAYSINSRIAASRWMNEADYRYYLTSAVILGGGLSYCLSTGKSANYGGRIREQDYAAYGNLKIRLNDWIINTGIRKEFYQHVNPPLQYSFGIRYKANERLVLRTALSNKFRKPTFNEKYWIPGGNPGLNPEKGWGGEISTEWKIAGLKENTFKLEMMMSAYFQHVDNWIQWVMRDSLTPVEYKNVHAAGLESRINFEVPAGRINIGGFFIYTYNRSVIVETYDHNPLYEGKQLMYIPRNSGRASLMAEFKGITLGAAASFTGYRETVETTDLSTRLKPYSLFDIFGGINRKIFGVSAGLYGHLDNIFNKQYEVIRSYPMPGRSFHFTLTLGFNRATTEQ